MFLDRIGLMSISGFLWVWKMWIRPILIILWTLWKYSKWFLKKYKSIKFLQMIYKNLKKQLLKIGVNTTKTIFSQLIGSWTSSMKILHLSSSKCQCKLQNSLLKVNKNMKNKTHVFKINCCFIQPLGTFWIWFITSSLGILIETVELGS